MLTQMNKDDTQGDTQSNAQDDTQEKIIQMVKQNPQVLGLN